jgi:arginine deiminase
MNSSRKNGIPIPKRVTEELAFGTKPSNAVDFVSSPHGGHLHPTAHDVQYMSESFKDICALVSDTNEMPISATPSRAKSLLRVGKESHEPMLKAQQYGENLLAEVVITCEPEGASLQMGGLHPRASLFEKPVNMTQAQMAHAEFRKLMRENNVRVLTVREILAYGTDKHVGARVELENFAATVLTYEPHSPMEEFTEADQYYLSEEYKAEVLSSMSVPQLIDTILINPTVHLVPSYRDTGLSATYSFKPLANLVYTRDQQITTAKGIIMGRLRSTQRNLEVSLMKFCFQKLGLEVLGAIEQPGFLEGGDFIPHSKDLAFIGIGLRSNIEACFCLMENDWLGYKRVAIVKDEFDVSQDRMHLDCVFGLLSETCCVCYEDMLGENSPKKRLVDEYIYVGGAKTYSLNRQNVEFGCYLKDNGINIINIPHDKQLEYACNILNLGDQRIISVHPEMARKIVRSEYFSGDVQCIDFSPITSMYGAVHCASQVVKRRVN